DADIDAMHEAAQEAKRLGLTLESIVCEAVKAVAPALLLAGRKQGRLEGLGQAAEAVERRGVEKGRPECCDRGVEGSTPSSECCGDPLLMISSEAAAAAIRALGRPA